MNTVQSSNVMKTSTGNIVRKAYSQIGAPVSSYAQAVSTVGFDIQALQMKHPVSGKLIPNETGLFRSDNDGCLAIHSDKFSFVQPSESLKVLERARQIVGGQWSSVQVNKGGRMIGAFIEVENTIVAPNRGDTIALSLGLFDHFDGNGLARINLSACNLTCTNGMTGLKSIISFASKHIGDVSSRLKVLEGSLQLKFVQAVDEMRGQVVALDSKPMTRAQVEVFAEQLFPIDPDAVNKSRVENQRQAVVTGFSRGTGNYGETRWDAFNAVTEYLDWTSTFRETQFSKQENRFESLLVGKGANTRARALDLLLSN